MPPFLFRLMRVALATVAFSVHAQPLDFTVECADTLIISAFSSSELMLVSPDELDARAGVALSHGRPLEAIEVAKEAVEYWRTRVIAGHAQGNLDQQRSGLNGLRWAQQSIVTILGLPTFPEAARVRYQEPIEAELLNSAVTLAQLYDLRAKRSPNLPDMPGLEIKTAHAYDLQTLIDDVQGAIPGEPFRMIYSPSVLADSGGAAAIDLGGFFYISHEAMTTLSPTYRENHELNHLRLESHLVQAHPSNFYGFDKALTVALPGPEDVYATTFSHNEPYNYQQDALFGIELYEHSFFDSRPATRNEGLELVINSASKGSRAALRQTTIAKGLAPVLEHLELQKGDRLTFTDLEATAENGDALFKTTCLQLNDSMYVGLYIQRRRSGKEIPWIVTTDGTRFFTLPLLDFSLSTAKALVKDFARIHEAITSGTSPENVADRIQPLFAAAKMAATEYKQQAKNADSMKQAFDSLLQPGMEWFNDQASSHSFDLFIAAMITYKGKTVPAIRANQSHLE